MNLIFESEQIIRLVTQPLNQYLEYSFVPEPLPAVGYVKMGGCASCLSVLEQKTKQFKMIIAIHMEVLTNCMGPLTKSPSTLNSLLITKSPLSITVNFLHLLSPFLTSHSSTHSMLAFATTTPPKLLSR